MAASICCGLWSKSSHGKPTKLLRLFSDEILVCKENQVAKDFISPVQVIGLVKIIVCLIFICSE